MYYVVFLLSRQGYIIHGAPVPLLYTWECFHFALASVAQLVGSLLCKPKAYGFDSWSGHRPGLQVWSLVVAHTEAPDQCFSVSLPVPPPAHSSSLSLSSKKKKRNALISIFSMRLFKTTCSKCNAETWFPHNDLICWYPRRSTSGSVVAPAGWSPCDLLVAEPRVLQTWGSSHRVCLPTDCGLEPLTGFLSLSEKTCVSVCQRALHSFWRTRCSAKDVLLDASIWEQSVPILTDWHSWPLVSLT